MTMLSRRNLLKLALSVSFVRAVRTAYCVPAAVNEQGFIPIGGIDQWIAIQGDDANNPVILFLHGGSADAQSPFLNEFLPWEHKFTVINWDQRGSGKTYGKMARRRPA